MESSKITGDGIGEVDRPDGYINGLEGGVRDRPGDSSVWIHTLHAVSNESLSLETSSSWTAPCLSWSSTVQAVTASAGVLKISFSGDDRVR